MDDRARVLSRVNAYAPLRPFEQRSADRAGLGVGLACSRWSAEANKGRNLYA